MNIAGFHEAMSGSNSRQTTLSESISAFNGALESRDRACSNAGVGRSRRLSGGAPTRRHTLVTANVYSCALFKNKHCYVLFLTS